MAQEKVLINWTLELWIEPAPGGVGGYRVNSHVAAKDPTVKGLFEETRRLVANAIEEVTAAGLTVNGKPMAVRRD